MTLSLIIGANRGIGLEICRQLCARGDEVIAACRSSSDELAGCGAQIVENIDVTSKGALQSLKVQLDGRTIDQLIVVAGILKRNSLDDLDYSSIERQFQVNAITP